MNKDCQITSKTNENILLVPSLRTINIHPNKNDSFTQGGQLASATPECYPLNSFNQSQHFSESTSEADHPTDHCPSATMVSYPQQDTRMVSKMINRILLDPNFSSNFVSALNQFLQSLLSDCLEFEQLVQITGNLHMSVDQVKVVEYTVDEKICKASTSNFIISNSSCYNKEDMQSNDHHISTNQENANNQQMFTVSERYLGDDYVEQSDHYTQLNNDNKDETSTEYNNLAPNQSYTQLKPADDQFQFKESASNTNQAVLTSAEIVEKKAATSKEYLCFICGKCYGTQGALKDHTNIHHEGKARYKCTICHQGFTSKTLYQGHMDSHDNLKCFMCSVCAKSFRYKINLKRHLLKAHGQELRVEKQLKDTVTKKDKQFLECSICQRCFKSKALLISHENSHDNVNSHHCDLCPKAFRYSNSLKDHKVREHHFPGKTHCCQTCPKVFAKKFELVRHANTCGPNKKLFQCPHCSKTSTFEGNLKRHIKVFHGSERTFECDKCSEVSFNLNDFRQHKKVCGKKVVFKCNLCPVIFLYEHNFKRHLSRLHGVNYEDYLLTITEDELT